MLLNIPDEDLTLVFGYLASGLFHATGDGARPATGGIWTLGEPWVWRPLLNHAAAKVIYTA